MSKEVLTLKRYMIRVVETYECWIEAESSEEAREQFVNDEWGGWYENKTYEFSEPEEHLEHYLIDDDL